MSNKPTSAPSKRKDNASTRNAHQRLKPPTNVLLYGLHPVLEALENPLRRAKTLWLDQSRHHEMSQKFEPILAKHDNPPALQWTSREYIAKMAKGDNDQPVPHQGVMLHCATLPNIQPHELNDAPASSLIIALDKVNDPHNVGAIMRSATAFGAYAFLTTDRHTPYESGLLAKTASGGMDRLPWIRTRNLGDTLEKIKSEGFYVVGLDGNATHGFEVLPEMNNERVVLVMGSEGHGLRERTLSLLDFTVRLPTSPHFPHLNVSNAAAIALYELKNRLTA